MYYLHGVVGAEMLVIYTLMKQPGCYFVSNLLICTCNLLKKIKKASFALWDAEKDAMLMIKIQKYYCNLAIYKENLKLSY